MRFIATLLLCLIATAAHSKTRHVEPFDRHAIYTIGSEAVLTERAVRKVRTAKRTKHKKIHKHQIAPASIASAPLVEKARALIGRTAAELGLPRSLWCADFIAKIAPEAARKVDNPRWARDYAELPKTSPKVGAIAVLSRGPRAGHIGVVSGFDSRGNPIIISGNHGHRVAEARYPKYRVLAYVSAE
jgi:uncharacterized protein (TIGR02594 family)